MSIKERRKEIIILWENDPDFLETLSSEEIFNIVLTFRNDEEINNLITKDINKIIARCSVDYDMYNYFTILALKLIGGGYYKEICDDSLNNTVKLVFSKESLIYLMKKFKLMKENGFIAKEELFNIIIEELKEMPTGLSSKILFDLYIFPDFNTQLYKQHRTIATLIEAYQIYDPTVLSSQIFVGSSIIGKLLNGKNEEIVTKYLRELLKEKQISPVNVKMIGGGSTSLVFKIRDLVIKFGETRHNRKIYINHRILASLLRKLELDEEEKELFYVEIMKYALVGDVTPEERDELKQDLFDQGLIWDDDKLENCGVLIEGDENISILPVDYIEVAAEIDNPYRREEFMKRKRKVVVIDNDNIRFNPYKSAR